MAAVRLLLGRGANAAAMDTAGHTAERNAMIHHRPEVAELLRSVR